MGVHHTYWLLRYERDRGFKVLRMVKRGTLFARCEWECDCLTYEEAMDVLDADSTWVLESEILRQIIELTEP